MSLFKYKNFEPTKTQIKYGIWDNDKVLCKENKNYSDKFKYKNIFYNCI